MDIISNLESDFEVTRKHLAVQLGMDYELASRYFSDSKLQAAQTADPATFARWLADAKAWRAEEKLSYH